MLLRSEPDEGGFRQPATFRPESWPRTLSNYQSAINVERSRNANTRGRNADFLLDETSPHIYLTDGGRIDNLGL